MFTAGQIDTEGEPNRDTLSDVDILEMLVFGRNCLLAFSLSMLISFSSDSSSDRGNLLGEAIAPVMSAAVRPSLIGSAQCSGEDAKTAIIIYRSCPLSFASTIRLRQSLRSLPPAFLDDAQQRVQAALRECDAHLDAMKYPIGMPGVHSTHYRPAKTSITRRK